MAEAKAHVAIARSDTDEARRLLGLAVARFEAAGQPLDVARCRELMAS